MIKLKMKNSVILKAEFSEAPPFHRLVADTHAFLLGHSEVLDKSLFVYEGPFSCPTIASRIFCYFGSRGNIIDYYSYQRTPEEFKSGSFSLTVISRNPRKFAEYLSQQLNFYFELEERNWQDTAINYARMFDRLKAIYTPEEIRRMLVGLRGECESCVFPEWIVSVFKPELVKNLEEILEKS